MSFLTRIRDHLIRSTDELEARELTTDAGRAGAQQIGDLADRDIADVVGVVRNLTMPPKTQVPCLVAELYDGTGALTLVWLGRREIAGITCGVRMRARGRVMMRRGQLTMLNPTYDLLPSRTTE